MLSHKGNIITNFVRLILKHDVHRMFYAWATHSWSSALFKTISIGFDDHFNCHQLLIGLGIVGVDPQFQKAP